MDPEKLEKYRLVKIKYEQSIKDYEMFERLLDDDDREILMAPHRNVSSRIRKRNNLVDWIWAPLEQIESLTELLDENEIIYKLVDHTSTYYKNPEKLSSLRREVDKFMEEIINTDFILDRIGRVGIENISKYEKKYIEKESKK